MFTLTGTSPSRLSSVPSPLLRENVWRDGTRLGLSVPARFQQYEVLRLLHYTSSVCLFVCLQRVLSIFFSSGMVEKLIELVRKCED